MTERFDDDTYYADARSWALDRAEGLARSARLGWIAAGVAAVLAVLEALALVALAPLKSVVPYTVLVDRTTGFTQTLDGTRQQSVRPDTALVQSLLAQYVIAREGYEINGLATAYRKIGLQSAGDARRDYLALMPATNPQSPLNLYPRAALVTVTVTSVTLAGPGTAQVRFVTERRDSPTVAPGRAWWVAELGYRFAGEPMSVDDRLENPLGFTVTRYLRNQEAVPLPASGMPVPTVPAASAVAVPIGPRGANP